MSLKTFIAGTICHPLVGRAIGSLFHDRIPSHGMMIETGDGQIQPKTKAELFWGIYESAEARFVHKYIRPGMNVIELGSSLGVISCLVRNHLQNAGKLICAEANPGLMHLARRNMENNAPAGSTFFVNAAIDYSGAPEVWLSFGDDSTSSVVKTRETSSTRSGTFTPAVSLSELLRKHAFEEFALVCDIEGAEYSILTNDSESMQHCMLAIMELHTTVHGDRTVTADQTADLFVDRCAFRIRDRYGPVFVFEKAS